MDPLERRRKEREEASSGGANFLVRLCAVVLCVCACARVRVCVCACVRACVCPSCSSSCCSVWFCRCLRARLGTTATGSCEFAQDVLVGVDSPSVFLPCHTRLFGPMLCCCGDAHECYWYVYQVPCCPVFLTPFNVQRKQPTATAHAMPHLHSNHTSLHTNWVPHMHHVVGTSTPSCDSCMLQELSHHGTSVHGIQELAVQDGIRHDDRGARVLGSHPHESVGSHSHLKGDGCTQRRQHRTIRSHQTVWTRNTTDVHSRRSRQRTTRTLAADTARQKKRKAQQVQSVPPLAQWERALDDGSTTQFTIHGLTSDPIFGIGCSRRHCTHTHAHVRTRKHAAR